MAKVKKYLRNSFSKAVKRQFISDFNKQPLSVTAYLSYLNENDLNPLYFI